ncbi:hypothetical protein KK083_06230 [Fulvivirgaceae bacterium PWU4]|uniref:Uncharacterized protein n=1 Tax=Chryseosolibacter histidini TaxID=2782349 RepID=A0AAP2DJC7_9BACT|nr:hypothetical protein [Chryseosolibacter histidini]MBT1696463.1 hypothetical protein [Chryseosolibacter histidini]
MLEFYFDKQIPIGFLLALAGLSWLAASSYLIMKALVQSNRAMLRSQVLYSIRLAEIPAVCLHCPARSFQEQLFYFTILNNDGKQQCSRDPFGRR